MKKMMIALIVMLTIAASGKAMSYEQARNEALFLTDKMAYELNLTDEQYEAAYEINLDYLMGVTSYDDVYGTYWERRNLDLSYIMLDWQWNAFIAASYFYRPLYWCDGFWHFGVYARYPYRDYFFFGRPVFYASYRGCHAWHIVGGRGYYYVRRDYFRRIGGSSHFGMLDRWKRGDFRSNGRQGYGQGRFGGSRSSSTRNTVNNRDYNNRGSFGGSSARSSGSFASSSARSSGSFASRTDRSNAIDRSNMQRSSSTINRSTSRSNGSFGSGISRSSNISRNSSYGSSSARSSGSFGRSYSRSSGSFGSSSARSSGSFGSGAMRSSTTRSSGSFSGSRSSGSFGGGSTRSSGSFGGSGRFGRGR